MSVCVSLFKGVHRGGRHNCFIKKNPRLLPVHEQILYHGHTDGLIEQVGL